MSYFYFAHTFRIFVDFFRAGRSYILKADVAGDQTRQKIWIFRRKIVWEQENYQFCNMIFIDFYWFLLILTEKQDPQTFILLECMTILECLIIFAFFRPSLFRPVLNLHLSDFSLSLLKPMYCQFITFSILSDTSRQTYTLYVYVCMYLSLNTADPTNARKGKNRNHVTVIPEAAEVHICEI